MLRSVMIRSTVLPIVPLNGGQPLSEGPETPDAAMAERLAMKVLNAWVWERHGRADISLIAEELLHLWMVADRELLERLFRYYFVGEFPGRCVRLQIFEIVFEIESSATPDIGEQSANEHSVYQGEQAARIQSLLDRTDDPALIALIQMLGLKNL